MFTGSIVALVTPFEEGEVDYGKLGELVEFQLENGTHGIVACGTTGEAPTLTLHERDRIIRTVLDIVKGRIPVIAGAGTSSTRDTIQQVRMAKEAGADGALVVTPYYNRPSQEGLYRHYEAIIGAVDIPIVIYNVPTRTGVNISPQTVAKLAQHRNIVAIKEASGSLEQVMQIRSLCDINVLSGEDSLTFAIMCLGGGGVIAVAPNIIPKQMAQMCSLARDARFEEAKTIHTRFYPLFKALFIETNPVPIKMAMRLTGMLNGELRAPLCEMGLQNQQMLGAVLRDLGLIRT
jgi:4-hydroxy-tetrahydrodipicolinate synthase